MNRLELCGKRLREARGKKTLKYVSNAVYISHATIVSYENNRSIPRLDLFLLLCDYYGVTPNQLLGYEEEQK